MGNNEQPPKPPEDQDNKAKEREQSAKAEKQTKRRPIWTGIKIACFSLGSLVVLGVAGGAGYVSSMLKGLPKVSAATFSNNRAASVVYDRNGKVIYRFKSDGDMQPIASTNQVSKYLANSFVAAEDKTFYSNIGINPMAMLRAVVQDLTHHRIESGASTITQQTVKLAVFPQQQRTARRKIQEIALALKVNHDLSKDEILTDYMNWVYMGRLGTDNVYGVKRASEIIFHEDPKNLTLAQSSFLAAIPNNPSYFSPYQYPKHTIERQHYILQQMLDNKMITQAEYNHAMKVNVLKEIHKPSMNGLANHPYLVYGEIKPRVLQALVKAGLYDNETDADAALQTGGYKIYTTIDLNKQADIESVLKNQSLFKGTDLSYKEPNGKTITDLYEAGVTLIDNQTGGILAIGGGRDFLKDGYDHADIARQPGSSIKPLLDYGPAIDQHIITAGTVLDDAPTEFTFGSKTWAPKDDESVFAGLMTARQALYESRNIPAIDILNAETPQVGYSYLNEMGIGPSYKTLTGKDTIVPDDESNLGTAIGGFEHGVTVDQLTSAYTTLANQGVWHQEYMISKIVDHNGKAVYTAHPKSNRVFSPQTAYIVTNMLHDVLYHPGGTATIIGYHFPGQYISGKTGTTDNKTNGWFVGYTPKYTMGIWMGYNNNEEINGMAANGDTAYNLKFYVWDDIMAKVLKNHPSDKPWPRPPGITTVDISSKSGMLPTTLSTAHGTVYPELFIDGTQPTARDNVDVEAKYVVLNGTKYLATTHSPPGEVRRGVFIKIPKDILDAAHKVPNGITADSPYLLPTQPDPRGGQVLGAGSPIGSNSSDLPAPANLHGQYVNGQVELSWDAVGSATHYAVYRATSQQGPYVPVSDTTNSSFTDSHLPAKASIVYYEVYAQSNQAMSGASEPFAIQVAAVPIPGGGDGGQNNTSSPTNNTTGNQANTTEPGSGKDGNNTSSPGGSGDGATTGNSTNKTNANGKGTFWLPGMGQEND